MSIIAHLQTCTTLSQLKSIHAALIKTSPTTPFSTNQLIAAASRLHHPDYALLLFTHLPHPNAFVYNALIAALSRSSSPLTALRYYSQMRFSDLPPTSYTFSSLIKAATASLAGVPTGRTLHGQVRKVGFHTDLFVQTALIDFYSNSDPDRCLLEFHRHRPIRRHRRLDLVDALSTGSRSDGSQFCAIRGGGQANRGGGNPISLRRQPAISSPQPAIRAAPSSSSTDLRRRRLRAAQAIRH